MTKQEYYDLLCESAVNGVFPCFAGSVCLYKGEGNKKCAVGILIPDEEFGDKTNDINASGSVSGLFECYPKFTKYLPEGFTAFWLLEIQQCHDDLVISNTCAVEWEPNAFIARLNALECFSDCNHKEPNAYATTVL